MSKEGPVNGAVGRVLDATSALSKVEMDRRQLLLRTVALGAAGLTGVSATQFATGRAMAQDVPQDELVTISQDQQQVWVKNFNPFLSAGSVRWPTHWGIHEPLLIFNALTG